jgi:S-adenosyl-L-methionine hydrolase (adenosine-forming)
MKKPALSRIITLTTDFGWRDAYVGSIKGVILCIAPQVVLVDITHEIPPHHVLFGAMVLREACPCYPERTTHVAVVDPGVGGTRRPILLQLDTHFYIGPDNGLFSLLLRDLSLEGAWELNNHRYFFPSLSSTFHGRDIFAPVAAHLATGVPPETFGPSISNLSTIPFPSPDVHPDYLSGEVIFIDRFGNCISNITYSVFKEWATEDPFQIKIQETYLEKIASSYDSVDPGDFLAIFNGLGYLEIARNQARADHALHLRPGEKVLVYKRKS